MLSPSKRTHHIDQWFDSDASNVQFSNSLFLRLGAKGKRFGNVDFKYSIFDTCYLRNCTFDSCDFTGCRFVSTNLHGSAFTGCTFDYSTFERTLVESEILDSGCPGHENLKMRFARTLRMNFQQVGDARSVNKAIKVELQATEIHLRKAWKSNESYYRHKYSGWKRIAVFIEWVDFKILDLVWGNGESALKLSRTLLFLLFVMALIDVIAFKDRQRVSSYVQSIFEMPQIFLGTLSPSYYSRGYLTIILFARLVAFGFFMSIIIKRFNRR